LSDGVWFQVLSLMIGLPCLMKGAVGLMFPGRFYRWRKGQYASDRPPAALYLPPLSLAAAVAVTWYATITRYVPWGWVVTVFVTAAAALGAANLLRWGEHQGRALRAVDSPATRRGVDLALIGIGAGFVTLAFAVY
jgi:hypothetical protein